MSWLLSSCLLIASLVLLLAGWRLLDRHADRVLWDTLLKQGVSEERRFSAEMLVALPEPAKRYFEYSIAAGTPLRSIVAIDMFGEIGMGSKTAPNYQPMRARQLLAPPFGLLWRMRAGRVSGSDAAALGRSWTRYWLLNLIPIVRADGEDHRRSAFGRVVSEAAFWVPASLLPGETVRWEAIDENSARAIVSYEDLSQAVEITVSAAGQPTQIILQRWSNENPERRYREQAFGGYPSDFQPFDGYRLPTRIEGGNLIGTPDYFPFFKARVEKFEFPRAGTYHTGRDD